MDKPPPEFASEFKREVQKLDLRHEIEKAQHAAQQKKEKQAKGKM